MKNIYILKRSKKRRSKVFENSYCEQGSSGNIMLLTLAMSISKNSVIEYYPLVYIYIYIYIYSKGYLPIKNQMNRYK